jgi:hypothetical protein
MTKEQIIEEIQICLQRIQNTDEEHIIKSQVAEINSLLKFLN